MRGWPQGIKVAALDEWLHRPGLLQLVVIRGISLGYPAQPVTKQVTLFLVESQGHCLVQGGNPPPPC